MTFVDFLCTTNTKHEMEYYKDLILRFTNTERMFRAAYVRRDESLKSAKKMF